MKTITIPIFNHGPLARVRPCELVCLCDPSKAVFIWNLLLVCVATACQGQRIKKELCGFAAKLNWASGPIFELYKGKFAQIQ